MAGNDNCDDYLHCRTPPGAYQHAARHFCRRLRSYLLLPSGRCHASITMARIPPNRHAALFTMVLLPTYAWLSWILT